MAHFWILDVLTDLRTFADENGLEDLVGQLDACHKVASDDLTKLDSSSIGVTRIDKP